MTWDLNCDLGEGEPVSRTRALMRWITSANVACGGHAGSASSMDVCVRLALEGKVRIGAHPGYADPANFGRRRLALSPGELKMLLLRQVGALEAVARSHGARLHHVKLHGALYHASEEDPEVARVFVGAVKRWWPKLVVYALASGRVARLGREMNLRVMEEAFLDRGYLDDGRLAPRGSKGAMLSRPAAIRGRLRSMRETGVIGSVNQVMIRLDARTLCIHGDTPNAVGLARTAHRALFSGGRNL